MNTKLSKSDLPYFFRKRLHNKVSLGKILELSASVSERESTISTSDDILRWADDGGQNVILDLGLSIATANPDTAQGRTGK